MEARTAVREARRIPELVRAGYLDTTNAHHRSIAWYIHAECIINTWTESRLGVPCLTRDGPLCGPSCCLLPLPCSDQGSAYVGNGSCLDVAPVCKQWGRHWLASVIAFCRIGVRRPEDWLMQVPFRRYMKEPDPISGSASPQSEDRPSHKEIPIANDRRTSGHDRSGGRTGRECAYAVAI